MSLTKKLTAFALPLLAVVGAALALPGPSAHAAPSAAPSVATAPAIPTGLSQKPQGQLGLNAVAPQALENPGFPDAYFYKPRSNRSMKPVIVWK